MISFDRYFINLRLNEFLLCWFLFLGWFYADIPWWILPSFILWSIGYVLKVFLPGKRKQFELDMTQYFQAFRPQITENPPEEKRTLH
jgi:hypothetical protein